jgi:hypothetical protein
MSVNDLNVRPATCTAISNLGIRKVSDLFYGHFNYIKPFMYGIGPVREQEINTSLVSLGFNFGLGMEIDSFLTTEMWAFPHVFSQKTRSFLSYVDRSERISVTPEFWWDSEKQMANNYEFLYRVFDNYGLAHLFTQEVYQELLEWVYSRIVISKDWFINKTQEG